ncbi:fgf [Lambdina fiscellaria nucleopolyhedrovirus]|uniref:Fgf n=1 Tax=Lambdina fiscellaria nucleopolyhedrovirus TaxID=1642929 RepID=A0A0E3UR96_9ABAC|nr:fgf [Lambdina fiscellaria nucleopolyhedrovirus]AKC91645.1 fgf [Lambdina fiscellaria nucleopolyhedrovirus]
MFYFALVFATALMVSRTVCAPVNVFDDSRKTSTNKPHYVFINKYYLGVQAFNNTIWNVRTLNDGDGGADNRGNNPVWINYAFEQDSKIKVAIRNAFTCAFVCINMCGYAYLSQKPNADCAFHNDIINGHTIYFVSHGDRTRSFLAVNMEGRMKKVKLEHDDTIGGHGANIFLQEQVYDKNDNFTRCEKTFRDLKHYLSRRNRKQCEHKRGSHLALNTVPRIQTKEVLNDKSVKENAGNSGGNNNETNETIDNDDNGNNDDDNEDDNTDKTLRGDGGSDTFSKTNNFFDQEFKIVNDNNEDNSNNATESVYNLFSENLTLTKNENTDAKSETLVSNASSDEIQKAFKQENDDYVTGGVAKNLYSTDNIVVKVQLIANERDEKKTLFTAMSAKQ